MIIIFNNWVLSALLRTKINHNGNIKITLPYQNAFFQSFLRKLLRKDMINGMFSIIRIKKHDLNT